MPVLTSVNTIRARQAGRDGAAQRHRRAAPRPGRARVAALRPRQDARVSGAGLVALADGREDEPRGSDARELLASAAALAGGRCARHRSTCTRRRIASSPAKPVTLVADVVDPTFVEVNDARVVAKVTGPKGSGRRRADAVDRRAQRRVPRHVPRRRPGHVRQRRSKRRAPASRSAPARRRCAPRRATRSTSTRRCTRRG